MSASLHAHSHPLAITENQETYADTTPKPSPTHGFEELMQRDQDRSPPLLMAPPRSRFQGLWHRVELSVVSLFNLLGLERDILNHVVRMVFFITKLMSLAQPCWPYMAKVEVGVPLIVIAALDLRVPEPATSALAHRNQRGEIEFGPSRMRGLEWSLVLVVFHTVVIWLARRWGTLCVEPSEEDWGIW